MRFLTRFLPSFVVSWLLTFTLASLFHSQYVVNQLVSVGAVISFNDRLSLTVDDWLGLLPTYGSIIAIAFLIAFLIAGWVFKEIDKYHVQLFTIAGMLAFVALLIAIESIMNIHIIAGARGWGFYLQLLSGAIGGFVFAAMYKARAVP